MRVVVLKAVNINRSLKKKSVNIVIDKPFIRASINGDDTKSRMDVSIEMNLVSRSFTVLVLASSE